MSDSHHFADELGFTRSFLEACTDLKLLELQDSLLRERPEDRGDERHAVLEELEKRQKQARADAVLLWRIGEALAAVREQERTRAEVQQRLTAARVDIEQP